MKHLRVLFTVALLVVGTVVGVSAAFAGSSSKPSTFCQVHPTNPRCKQPPAATATPTPTSTATATTSPVPSSTPTPTPTPTAPPTTATPTPTPSPTTTPTTTPTTSPTTATPTPTPTPTPTSSPSPGGQKCTNPSIVFNGQDSRGLGDYYADADIWNPYPGMSQTMGVCSYSSWYTVDTADNSTGDGAVKAYPNVHKDFIDWGTGVMPKLSSYGSITTSFANTSPRVGIYDTAYDIWFNDIGNSSTSNEVMIWTDNKDQYPLGSLRGQTTFSGVTWDVWATNPDSTGASYVAFIPVNGGVVTSGTIDVKAVAAYLQGTTVNGAPLLPASSTIGQVDYGVEVVSTNGSPARWDFTRFDVTTS